MARLTQASDLAALRASGRIAAAALSAAAVAVRPDVTTAELNVIAERVVRAGGGRPTFLGYQGYPATLCTSINDEVVHGIPRDDRRLRTGDIIGLDIGVECGGAFTDHAITVPVGAIRSVEKKLLADTLAALEAGMAAVRPGGHVGDIGAAVAAALKPGNYGIVRQLTGHGVGRAVHEEPSIPNYGRPGTGSRLEVGMVLAIEPMVTLGGWEVRTEDDGWTSVTVDGSRAAHFEHTVLVTPVGAEVITHV